MPPLTPMSTPGRPLPRRAAHAGRARAGLSLPEVLIGFVLLGVLGTALVKLLMVQSTAFARTQAATAVQRDMRTGLSLLPQDLRAASRTRGDLLAVSQTAIELRATIGTSIVCATAGNGRTLYLPPLGQVNAGATLTSWFAAPRAQADDVFVLTRATTGGQGDWWIAGRVSQDPGVATGAAVAACIAPLPFVTSPLPTTVPPVQFTWTPTDTLNAAGAQIDVATMVRPGTALRITRRVRYQLYQAGSGRWYLGFQEYQGANVWSALEPIAGPYDAGGTAVAPGIAFAYTGTEGQVLASPVDPSAVARVDLVLRPRTVARTARSEVIRDSLLVRIALRNRCTVGFERC